MGGTPPGPDSPQAASGVIQPSRSLIIEVLDARGHQVRARVRLDRYPLTVGRAYSSDVILDDPYADARHLRIVWDAQLGAPVAEDLGSVNGVSEAGRAERVSRVVLRPGTELRVGRTVLRFCDPDQPVPPALPDRQLAAAAVPAPAAAAAGRPDARPALGQLSLGTRAGAAAACVGALALFALESYLENTERTNLAKVLSGTLFMLVPFAAWAGAWALGGRMVVHRFNYLPHLATALLVGVAFTLATEFGEWLDFYFPEGTPSSVVSSVLGCLLAAGLIAGHLRFASHLPRGRRWRVGAGAVTAVAAVIALNAYADRDDFTSQMEYSSSLKPVGAGRVPAVPLAEFTREVGELQAELDEIAERMREKEK